MRIFFVILLALLVPHVHAGTAKVTAPTWTFTGTKSATVSDSGAGTFASLIREREYVPAANRGVTLQDVLRGPVQSAAIAEMSYGRVATAAAVDMAIGRAIAVATVGMAAYEIASAVRCKALGAGATGCDDGVDPVPTQVWSTGSGPSLCQSVSLSVVAECVRAQRAATLRAQNPNTTTFSTTSTYVITVTVQSTNETTGAIVLANSVILNYVTGTQSSTPTVYPPQQILGGTVTTTAGKVTGSSCPASIDASNPANNIPAGAPVGVDGKCATGRYAPKTPEQVAEQVAKDPNVARRAPALKEALDNGGEVETSPGALTGPSTVTGQPSTRTETGPGGTTTTTTTPRTRFTYDGPSVTAADDPIVVTGHPDGTTTTTEGAPPPSDIITCGLPDTPPCKIDETGTPVVGDMSAGEAAIDAERGKAVTAIEDSAKRTSLPWSWTWALPTGACSAFTFGTNARPMVVNPCSVSGVHLWRSILAWMLAIMTGIHIWQSVKELGS